MQQRTPLSFDQIERELISLPQWGYRDGKLHREYRFGDFNTAFAFIAGVAALAQQLDHHPDWCNSWNRVTIELTTHDAGGVTMQDFQLAREIEQLAIKLLGEA